MKKIICSLLVMSIAFLSGCSSTKEDKDIKIGVSMGVGPATRWDNEKTYMEERAKELGIQMEVRINRTDEPLTQEEDCKEMIDQGIDVLILTPRDVNNVKGILDYAKEKNVKVISYARAILKHNVDLYVGYDSTKLGQMMGQYVVELAYKGDYIILRGDKNDFNAKLINDGAMKYVDEIRDQINILLETDIEGWNPQIAKDKIKEAVSKNGNKIDAILAPNDKLAAASYEALKELGVTTPVVITGMDAELDAIQRIDKGTQSSTIYMDLKELAYLAVDEAYHMAKDEKVNVNSKFDNGGEEPVDANLIVGTLITKENIERQIIDKKIYTKEQIYGE